MTKPLASTTITEGIRVTVTPHYLARESDPEARKFLFAYRIVIANEGDTPATLVSRHWIIVDAHGSRRDVQGEGVVGETPRLEPGKTFEYSSHCPLETEWGTMEGTYLMERDGGETFNANIDRFFLVSQPPAARPAKAKVK
jgi:ApaG protein